MNLVKKIPLFPLGVVMLPEMMLPLHIFEERYKTMVIKTIDLPYYRGFFQQS